MTQLNQIYTLLLLVAVLPGCTTIGYYSQAIGGHASLMWSSQPVDELLQAPDTAPALAGKLTVAREARRFAQQRLALPVGEAFTEYSELGRPWVVVNLVAAPEFSLTPRQWCYPVAGCQAYRGYFRLEDAREEQRTLAARGYDTFIGGVTAYSTLGWFDDPLHSGFTSLPEDRMVALMFHELAHRVVYVDEDTAFNESFATAVELEGLRLWLEQRGDSARFHAALQRLAQRNQTLALVDDTVASLERLYQRAEQAPVAELRQQKQQLMAGLAERYNALAAGWEEPGPFGDSVSTLNNANLALFRQYNQYVPGFRQLLREHDYNFTDFFVQVRALAAQDAGERTRRLALLSERFNEHL
ncbi:zinc protease [Marinobacter lipolyticus]|uniref:aminopeptidase n=1 Tax=Marinobacter lipolyticus TaxID=209639 RepID=UPI001BCF4404|nr:aminopeptidase [Marinobacter lipolyticus]MBS8240381.1 zinc protease [Marinobacter lipolyticus]